MIHDEDLTPEQRKEKYEIRFKKIDEVFTKYLQDNGCVNALEAKREASTYHKGLRKNGAPEFMHQLEICLFLILLPNIPQDKKELDSFLCAALLHDVREDYDVSDEHVRNKYGDRTADLVELLTKVFKGKKKSEKEYFNAITTDPLAIILKLADRFHNMSTMHDAFTYKKQKNYIQEVKDHFYPMMKTGLKSFPEYYSSLYILKTNIEVLCHTIQSSIVYIEKLKEDITSIKDHSFNAQVKLSQISTQLEQNLGSKSKANKI